MRKNIAKVLDKVLRSNTTTISYGKDAEPYRMSREGDFVLFENDKNECLVLPISSINMYAGTHHPKFYKLGIRDTYEDGSLCTFMGVKNGVEYFVRNDTWIPDKEALLPNRIVPTGVLTDSVISKRFWVSRNEELCLFINYDGKHFAILMENVYPIGIQIPEGRWFECIITKPEQNSCVIQLMDEKVPILYDWIYAAPD